MNVYNSGLHGMHKNLGQLSSNPRTIPTRSNPRTAYRPRVRGKVIVKVN